MNGFMKRHPALADACDTVLGLLSGAFALPAAGLVWLKETIKHKKGGGAA